MANLDSLMSGGWEPDYGDFDIAEDWEENEDICEGCPRTECADCEFKDLHQTPAEQLGLVPVCCPPGQPVEEDELPF